MSKRTYAESLTTALILLIIPTLSLLLLVTTLPR